MSEPSARPSLRQGQPEERHGGTDQEASPGITHSINPGVPCPETVLVAVMIDGSYLLMAYPQREPAALVARDDAGPLSQALKAAFESFTSHG